MLLTTFLLLLYGVFATIFHDTEMVGSITMAVGKANIALFGYMAYLDMFFIAYLIHIFMKHNGKRDISNIFIGWILLFLSLVMIEALIFDFQDIGIVSSILYLVLKSAIGKVGYSIFAIFSLILSVLILKSENQFEELYNELLEIDSVAEKNFQTFSKNIRERLQTQDSSFDFESYTPPKPKSKLEREREKLRKIKPI